MNKATEAVTALFILICVQVCALAWTPEQNLTPSYVGAASPSIVIGIDGTVHCVYAVQPSGGALNLFYRSLTGAGWSSPQDLPGPNYKEPECDIAVDGAGRVHVVGVYRVDGTTNTPYTVYYWEYDGNSWIGPVMLSSGTGSDSNSCISPRVAVDMNNDLHVVWSQDGMTGGEGDIMHRKRQSGVWQSVQNITQNNPGTSYGSSSPDIAVDRNGTTVHVVWHDDFSNYGFQVYYTKNTNLGAPGYWLPSNQWFQLSTADYGKAPRIVLDRNDYPHCFWADRFGGSSNVQAYRRWTGSSWTSPVSWGGQWYQAAEFDAGNLMHYLYTADSGGTLELFYRTYDLSSFSTPELVSAGGNTLKVDSAGMTLDSTGNAYALWGERKGEWPGTGFVFFSVRSTAGPPDAVSCFEAVHFDTGANLLTWQSPSSPSFTGTMIRYKASGYPTSYLDGELLCDRAGSPGSTDSFIHSGIVSCSSAYYAAFAHNAFGQYSTAVYASAPPHPLSLGYIKQYPDSQPVDLCGKVVTAVFPADTCIYVAEPDRSSGIRVVWSGSGLSVGDEVSIVGTLTTRKPDGVTPSERQITASAVTVTGSVGPLRPLSMICREVGGATTDPYVPGVLGGEGLNNIGSLVQIAGKVTYKVTSYIYVDDGTNVPDISGRVGVMVRCPSTTIPAVAGDMVVVTGIVEGSIPTGWNTNRRLVGMRDWSDLIVYSTDK